jgi:hypothetical protein
MPTITVEVPDDLAAELNLIRADFPAFVREAVEGELAHEATSSSRPPLYQEIIDFLASAPAVSPVVVFRVSEHTQKRLDDVLINQATLTPAERADVEQYLEYRRLMIQSKARARKSQIASPANFRYESHGSNKR